MTFNPGLTGRGERVRQHTDVREIERTLRDAGIENGNAILIDQFF